MWLLVSFGLFTILLMVADGIKINKMNKQKVDDSIDCLLSKVSDMLNDLLKKKKKQSNMLRSKKEIADLEKVLNED